MAVHSITVKKLISRVRLVFPDAPEAYIMNLINDALVEIGMYKTKVVTSNHVLRVYIIDNEGDYIKIPRLIDKEILLADVTNESNLNIPN